MLLHTGCPHGMVFVVCYVVGEYPSDAVHHDVRVCTKGVSIHLKLVGLS